MRSHRRRLAVTLVLAGALGAGLAAAHGTPAAASVAAAPVATRSPTPTATRSPSPSATRSPAPSPTRTPLPAPRPAGKALTVQNLGAPVLTLPAKDGLRDSTRIRIRSGAKGTVDLLAIAGTRVVHLADALPLRRATVGWSRTVTTSVSALPAGTWTIRARRSDERTVRARTAAPLVVGSGLPVHVLLNVAHHTVYPYRDGVLDTVDTAVVVTDETGLPLPFTGREQLQVAGRTRSVALGRTGLGHLPVTGLPLGAAKLVTTVTAPAGPTTRTTAITLAPTGAGRATLARSADTVQPVVDGLLDSVTFTTSGAAVQASPAAVTGTLTVALGTAVVQRWTVPDGGPHPFVWDGRTKGVIVPGSYTATLSLRGPEGVPRTTTKTVVVTKAHLPYRVQDLFTVAAGNQQGLAVHDGTFYVGFDNGDGTARIDEYSSSGALTGSLGPLAIGHAAELSYSTTTGKLYAANGGAGTATKVWAIDPAAPDAASAIVSTFDLTALGPNGMVAVDDANQRLLVFAGSAGAYTVTPVSMSDVTTTDASGTATTVPAGTPGTSVPIAIVGIPQGIEVVGQQLWVYTSMKQVNHLAKYDLSGVPVPGADGSSDLMWAGEGEGLAYDPADPQQSLYVGAHAVNRVGVLRPVADE